MKATLLVLMSWAASGASDMEPLPLSTARRLLDLTVDATCLSSCSGLDTLITELTNFTQQLPRRATVNDMTGGMLDVMCSHNTAVTCMSNQCTVPADLVQLIPLLGCVCTACPSYSFAQVASVEATMSSTNMTAVCPVIGPLECAATSSACAPVVVKTAGLHGMIGMKPNCLSFGYSTGTNDRLSTLEVVFDWFLVFSCVFLFLGSAESL